MGTLSKRSENILFIIWSRFNWAASVKPDSVTMMQCCVFLQSIRMCGTRPSVVSSSSASLLLPSCHRASSTCGRITRCVRRPPAHAQFFIVIWCLMFINFVSCCLRKGSVYISDADAHFQNHPNSGKPGQVQICKCDCNNYLQLHILKWYIIYNIILIYSIIHITL